MKTNFKPDLRAAHYSFGAVCCAAAVLQLGLLAGYAQTGDYLYSGSERTVTLNPGLYDITAYGAQGGTGSIPFNTAGGLGAEMSGEFYFSANTMLTLLVGGAGAGSGGGAGGGYSGNGGGGYSGGGGSFLSGGSGGYGSGGGSGGYGGGAGGFGGGGGGGGYTGGGGGAWGGSTAFAGGGGGSIIDSSAIVDLAEVSGVASPDDPTGNGEIIITAVPEPSTLALAGLSGLSLLLFRRQRN